MEIKALGARLTQRIASPFKAKSTSTNPFENNSFSGRTFNKSVLPFADVFQTTNTNKTNKLKMMSASVVSAVTNIKQRITQPIVNFANNVKARMNNTISAVKSLPQKMSEMKNNLQTRISEKLHLNRVAEYKAEPEIKVLNMKEINTKASIADLKNTWVEENKAIANSAKEAA